MRALFDSNIVIDFLNGQKKAAQILEKYQPVLSIVSYIEVLTGAIARGSQKEVLGFLRTFEIIELDRKIADLSAKARIEHKLKTPDAIIYATAKACNLLFITRNSKDFDRDDPIVEIPYEI